MIHSIYTSPRTEAPQQSHQSIEAIAGQGLAGDRYSTGKGHYSGVKEWDAHVTLMDRGPFLRLQADHDIEVDPALLRRNLLTESIDLNLLIDKTFQVGDEVILKTRKLWPPCTFIVEQTGRKEIFEFLAKSTGIGASVLQGGTIQVGDSIKILDAP